MRWPSVSFWASLIAVLLPPVEAYATPPLAKPNSPIPFQAPDLDTSVDLTGAWYVEFDIVVGPVAGELESFVLEVLPSWAPIGSQRLRELVEADYFKGAAFFRVLPHFMAQFGLAADPKVNKAWASKEIKDDPKDRASNARGTMSFAMRGPNTRTSQLFLNFVDNSRLDPEGFTPVGRVVRGMEFVDRINNEYKETPAQGKIHNQGAAYLKPAFPHLSYIASTRVLGGKGHLDGRTLVACGVAGASAPLVIDVREDWAPLGAARFMELASEGALDGTALFRAVPDFLCQFGIPKDLDLRRQFTRPGATIKDDPSQGLPIARGVVSFAGGGRNTRDAQLFVAFAHLDFLGKEPWEVPLGRVVQGHDALDAIYTGYGDMAPDFGTGPDQSRIQEADGYDYLRENFPKLSYFGECEVLSVRPDSTLAALAASRPNGWRKAVGRIAVAPPAAAVTLVAKAPQPSQALHGLAVPEAPAAGDQGGEPVAATMGLRGQRGSGELSPGVKLNGAEGAAAAGFPSTPEAHGAITFFAGAALCIGVAALQFTRRTSQVEAKEV